MLLLWWIHCVIRASLAKHTTVPCVTSAGAAFQLSVSFYFFFLFLVQPRSMGVSGLKKKGFGQLERNKKKLSLTAVEIESHASLFQFRYQQHRRRKGGIDYAMQLNSCPCAVCVPFLCCPRTARTKALSVGLVCLYNITVMCSFPLENKKRNWKSK